MSRPEPYGGTPDEELYDPFVHNPKEAYDRMVVYNISPALDDLLFSLFIFLVTVWVCNVFREIVLFSPMLDSLREAQMYKLLVSEFLGMMEEAVSCYEINVIIYEVFGLTVYGICIFLVTTWQSKRPPEYQYEGNPLNVIVKFIETTKRMRPQGMGQYEEIEPLYGDIRFCSLILTVQALSAYAAFNLLVHFAWKNASIWTYWERSNYHLSTYKHRANWTTSIATPASAALCEGGFSMALYLMPIYLAFRGFRGEPNIILLNFAKALCASFAAPYSGGYFNPATSYTLENHKHGYSETIKILVYCASPVVGTLSGMFAMEMLNKS